MDNNTHRLAKMIMFFDANTEGKKHVYTGFALRYGEPRQILRAAPERVPLKIFGQYCDAYLAEGLQNAIV